MARRKPAPVVEAPRAPVRLIVHGESGEVCCRGCGATVPLRSLPGFTVKHLICADRSAAFAA